VIAKFEWHPSELFPRVGFIVTNLPMEPEWVVRFYNQRGTAEQHIKEGKYAFRWTRLSCRRFRANKMRLQLYALTYNLAIFLRCIDLPEAMADCSLTSLQLKQIKIGARVVRHARAITFQLAEVAATGPMMRQPLCALPRSKSKLNESGRTSLPNALKNVAAGPGCFGFGGQFAQLRTCARPQTPLGAENA
jgi:hypothetical protein